MKIWFQNRRTKWKKLENISSTQASEHKLTASEKQSESQRLKQLGNLKLHTGKCNNNDVEKQSPIETDIVAKQKTSQISSLKSTESCEIDLKSTIDLAGSKTEPEVDKDSKRDNVVNLKISFANSNQNDLEYMASDNDNEGES